MYTLIATINVYILYGMFHAQIFVVTRCYIQTNCPPKVIIGLLNDQSKLSPYFEYCMCVHRCIGVGVCVHRCVYIGV